jgi:hypothetical protein
MVPAAGSAQAADIPAQMDQAGGGIRNCTGTRPSLARENSAQGNDVDHRHFHQHVNVHDHGNHKHVHHFNNRGPLFDFN